MKQTAILTVGYMDISLPAEKAMKAMQLLAGGLVVDRRFDEPRETWMIEGPVRLTLKMLRGDERFVSPAGETVDVATPAVRKALTAPRKAIAGPRS